MESKTTFERPLTVDQFQTMYEHIYGQVNRGNYDDKDLILRLIEETTEAMELARKDKRHEFYTRLPRIYSWFNAVANRFNINLQEALWKKYPGVCPYCLREQNCACQIEHPEIPNKDQILRRLRRERQGREPQTLSDHQKLHGRLYGKQNERIFPIQTVAHLVEEVGEISRDFRHGRQEELTAEMADVASWIFAIANRLGFNLADIIWENYPYECEICNEDQCVCPQPV